MRVDRGGPRHDGRARGGARGRRARRGADRDPVGPGHDARAGRAAPAASAACRCARCRPSSSCCRPAAALTRQLREVRVEDVLGREPVRMEIESVGGYLTGRCVLVTGAGGSIGSELCRQIARVNPSRLVLVDNGEANLFEIERELVDERHVLSSVSVLADCKDDERMREVFAEHRPGGRLPRRRVQARRADGGQPDRGGAQQRARHAHADGDRRRVRRRARSCSSRPTRRSRPATVMGASKALAEWAVEAADARYRGHGVLRRALRQRARLLRLGRADLPPPDRGRRAGDGHRPGDDALLHDDPGGGPARDPLGLAGPGRRGLRARDGRAGADHGSRRGT